MLSLSVIQDAQHYLNKYQLNGWLIYDYHHSNPVFWQLFGNMDMVTRPCFFFIPSTGKPCLVVHHVDAGRFKDDDLGKYIYSNRDTMVEALARIVSPGWNVAMEYSPMASIPRASKVDAGTVELVRTLGVEIISSSDLLQYATLRWNEIQLHSHMRSAQALGQIALDAFKYVGEYLGHRPTEYEVAELIRRRFSEYGLVASDGPIVATNEHCSDPHYQPQPNNSSIIRKGDWLLIDLWARENTEASVYADITWVGYVGRKVPKRQQEVFEVVAGARDASLTFLNDNYLAGRTLQGCEVDLVAREYIARAGYGEYFTHRLGHSLGHNVHGEAVNLDSYETRDTRHLVPGIGFTIEPGIYLNEFGIRSEINVFMSEDGPVTTTPVQHKVVLMHNGKPLAPNL